MLIIAIPKSASTSLMLTISKLHNLNAKQDFSFTDNSIPDNCNILYSFHGDIRELKSIDFLKMKNTVVKQHLYPSSNNLNLTYNVKKVILLREPSEIVLAYRRGAIKSIHNLLNGYSVKMTEKEWLDQAKNDGLFSDLNFFCKEWINKSNPKTTLFVSYRDYVDNPKKVINKIEEFYGLKITARKFSTVKARFSRRSTIGDFSHSNYLKLKSYLINILIGIRNNITKK
ncbi:sulfotransferase domain-containing protein [uncultured Cyclobacterium sp.]|uniref:sulfotransferase domain-containing protein n=1 Tax=uncultured Cyclobacterium sp. TaxID=453820 RepID=UPI0030EB8720|tara:strand:- start:585 stop:1268 length:684 start_codon:yes stop_codon:yes gene_type:complete